MDPLAIAQFLSLAENALTLAHNVAVMYPTIRDTLSSNDQAVLDVQYASIVAKSNQIAEKLQAIPDDPMI